SASGSTGTPSFSLRRVITLGGQTVATKQATRRLTPAFAESSTRSSCMRRLWEFGGPDQGVEPARLGSETVDRAVDIGKEGEVATGLEALTAEEGDILSRN